MVQIISQEVGATFKTNLAGTPFTKNITLPFKPQWVRLRYCFLDSVDNASYFIQNNLSPSGGFGFFNPKSGIITEIYQYIPDFQNGDYTFYPYKVSTGAPFVIPDRECTICFEFYNSLGVE